MALTKALTRSIGCSDCQQWVLRTFMSSLARPNALASSQTRSHRQFLSQSSRRPNNSPSHEPSVLNNVKHPFESASTIEESESLSQDKPQIDLQPDEITNSASATQTTTQTDLPWYLQVQSQETTRADSFNPLLARQRLPDLPSNPPSILQPLLEHISIDLGLDDLTILDLRTLDPPPALGANLLMLIGTARSEKHLHVSADRLCRWLRTEFKLHPHADGLLGRNELKIQMRRKARRARLLSSTIVGSQDTGEREIEDGIRTGWVCVNVGRVEGGDLPEMEDRVKRREEGIIGFGARLEGYSSMVVQMLTEEKRGEVDLERLWYGILRRAERDRNEGLEDAEAVNASA